MIKYLQHVTEHCLPCGENMDALSEAQMNDLREVKAAALLKLSGYGRSCPLDLMLLQAE